MLFTEPLELDPSRRAARVTRQLAERLAKLAASLEQTGHSPEQVAGFLMRCLFTMFAEDVRAAAQRLVQQIAQRLPPEHGSISRTRSTALWQSMDKGGFDPALRTHHPAVQWLFCLKTPRRCP